MYAFCTPTPSLFRYIDKDTTTQWAWEDNGVNDAVMGDGCKCARWWKAALYVPGLRERLGGNNMHDAEKEQSRALHINADACSELAVSHMLGRGRMGEIEKYTTHLGKMESNAFLSVGPCIAREIGQKDDGSKQPYSIDRLMGCVRDAWVPVKPPRKTHGASGWHR
jgi:hypothetical protein